LPPAGVIPPGVSLSVTGSPADGSFVDTQIRDALDRQIRPTLRPGSSISYGPIVPWPILPLPAAARTAVNVTVTITGNDTSASVSGTTLAVVDDVVTPPPKPVVLFLSDDPEYLQSEGLVFRGNVALGRAARLYYYHADLGLPRDVDVVLTADAPSRVQLVQSKGGPELDVMNVGHIVTRDVMLNEQRNQGILIDLAPGKPVVVRHDLILQGELVAGAIDLSVLSGAGITASVVASPAGGRPETYLAGPRVALDGHNRHGIFDLNDFGNHTATYAVGGPDTAVKYGGRTPTPRNVDPNDSGRDYGDYGVLHNITFTLMNPTSASQLIYLYAKPLGGPVRSTFIVDGQFKEMGCARLPVPYWLTTYQLPPLSKTASTTLTMTDGGSFYPIEFGVTATQPASYTPPIHTADGCSPSAPAWTAPTAVPQPAATPLSTSSRA